jgi:hypothetical protein
MATLYNKSGMYVQVLSVYPSNTVTPTKLKAEFQLSVTSVTDFSVISQVIIKCHQLKNMPASLKQHVYLIMSHACHEGIYRSGGIAQLILNLSTKWR